MPANATQPRLNFGSAGNWNAIEARARDFVDRWEDSEGYEKGESQHFWSELLAVFGIDYKRVGAFFEYRTRKLSGAPGFVDLFYPGKLVAEQKSAGRDLNRAMTQALDYLPAMPDHELPRAIIASDFKTFDLVRLENRDGTPVPQSKRSITFTLEQLPERVRHFDFLFDLDLASLSEQNPVNVKAAQDISKLHEELKKQGYRGKDLEVFLTRVVFCLFAEDTGIFDAGQFRQYLANNVQPNGYNLGRVLNELFEVLDTPKDQRQLNMPPELAAFPYVNGGLFKDRINTPQLDAKALHAIRTASLQNWAEVNPSIFGSMFQGVMDEVERRELGAHYTSEKNILRLIQPLFIDDLYAEFEAVKDSPTRRERFHDKLATLKFLDPACGSGNFLVITYRELRRLEHKVIQAGLKGQKALPMDIAHLIRTSPDQMAGIELEEFPAKVAELALWLTDHQMNIEAAKMFGGSIDIYARIPIKSQPNIVNANALRIDWGEVVELSDLDYIIGNPPFNGSKYMTPEQRDDLKSVFPEGMRGVGILDFVTGWYAKSAQVMERNPKVRAALVSTNSISQGEQVGVLWGHLLEEGVHIDFAHRTFQWQNEAPGVAAVFCVIIGFSKVKNVALRLFDYDDIRGEPMELVGTKRINPYLVDAPDVVVVSRQHPISDVPEIGIGNQAIDDGQYLFTPEDKEDFLAIEPEAERYFHPWIGAREFLQGHERWVMWLGDADPSDLRKMPEVLRRISNVRTFRLASRRGSTVKLADYPTRFQVENMPKSNYLLVPSVSSERREYVPIGFMTPDVFSSNLVLIVPNAKRYHFGILTSQMHMAWMRLVAGRLEGRYRYSKDIVYNNFPWPEDVSDAQRQQIEELAQAVLDAREAHPTSTLADLYDPLAMPSNLRKAHNDLDRAVDRLYRAKPFVDDAERVALLLRRYQTLTANE